MPGPGFAWAAEPASPCWEDGWSGDAGAGKLRPKLSPNGVPVQPVCNNKMTVAAAMVAGVRQGLGISYLRA